MSLEHFKTQVLLLHSEQSTLDVLSAGFGARYAVHLATSGTEALNTLGETPIHVIVSAQDLPGMSGLEALREAKKRSPDTIGILLAGSDRDDGLEALVGDQEVFQIVRGQIGPEALRNLIDTATKRIRLLAISESANDLAANVDEPVDESMAESVGEHIVMETSENGASIISDGTGRLPVLKQRTAPASPNAGGRQVDVLVLTKDQEFLATIRESARGLHNVHTANTPAQTDELVRQHKIGILVTDAAMVGSNIEAVTERLRRQVPRLVAIVAGRRDDGELLMDLINRGQVYRFLLKPVSPGRARLAIEASVKHHLEARDSSFRKLPRGDGPAPAPKAAEKIKAASPKAAGRESNRQPPSIGRGPERAVRDSGRPAAPPERSASAGSPTGARTDAPTDDTPGTVAAANSGEAKRGFPGRLLTPKRLAGIAGALVIAGAAGWWYSGWSYLRVATPPTSSENTAESTVRPSPSIVETDIPQVAEGAASPEGAATVPEPPPYPAKLDEARIARDAGEIVTPPETNAIELYLAARAMAPDDPVITAELDAVIDQALSLVESALLAKRVDDAAAGLRLVRLANPDNPRLPFLDAQVAELELQMQLDIARAAIHEQRFEDAAAALAAAGKLAGNDQSSVDVLAGELASARSQQQVTDVLALATARLEQDSLIAPSNDNARYYYELALSNDRGNATARQGLTLVAGKLVLRARTDIDAGKLDDAEDLLFAAGELDPDSSELSTALLALDDARAKEEAQALAEQQQKAAAEKAAAAALADSTVGSTVGSTVDDRFAPGIAEDGSTSGIPAGGSDAIDTLGGSAFVTAPADSGNDTAASGSAVPPAAAAMQPSGQSSGQSSGKSSGKSSNTSSAGPSNPNELPYVPISSLTRTNYVVPEYPRSAARRNITGWIDVSFVVNSGGTVENVEILNADPGDFFNDSAREAILQWQFEPPTKNGVPVAQHVAVRLSYNLK